MYNTPSDNCKDAIFDRGRAIADGQGEADSKLETSGVPFLRQEMRLWQQPGLISTLRLLPFWSMLQL